MQSVKFVLSSWLVLASVGACAGKKISGSANSNGTANKNGPVLDANGKPIGDNSVGSGSTKGLNVGPEKEAYMCQDGKRVLAQVEKQQFLEQFSLICDDTGPNQRFRDLIANAYDGSNEAKVTLIGTTTDDMFNTRMTVAFAMKAPLADPSQFFALKAHDVLANGLRSNRSELVATVESRRNFPGRRSIEEIILNYSLNKSEGGGLYDVRRTEFNTYLLDEARTDVTISTEELLDADKSQSYNGFRGMVVGIQAANNQTYLVFINDMFIKNRIDPLRLQRTLLALNGEMQKVMFPLFVKGATK